MSLSLRPYQLEAIEGARAELRRKKAAEATRRWRLKNPERAREVSRAHYARNGERRRESTRKWGKANPLSLKRSKFACSLRKYGITVEDYARLEHAQERRCAGCRERLGDGWKTAVDHCHRTNRVRGLLCIRCNRSIGVLLEHPETLRRLATYLETHR